MANLNTREVLAGHTARIEQMEKDREAFRAECSVRHDAVIGQLKEIGEDVRETKERVIVLETKESAPVITNRQIAIIGGGLAAVIMAALSTWLGWPMPDAGAIAGVVTP